MSMHRFALVALFLLLAQPANAQSIEFVPPVEWDEPPVVTPGETDAAPPSDAIVLFDGTDLSAWENGESWKVEDGVAVVAGGQITTRQHFGDCQLHVEWSAPTKSTGSSQGRGNSGVYMMGLYEVQVLDSYDNPTYFEGQAAAVYKQTPPMVNAMRPPGEWNAYDIFWTSPRFEEGELVSPAYVTVVHNGVLVVNQFQLQGGTFWDRPAKYEDPVETGPIMLQDHGDPVRFRNIWVREWKRPTSRPREGYYIDHDTGERMPVE